MSTTARERKNCTVTSVDAEHSAEHIESDSLQDCLSMVKELVDDIAYGYSDGEPFADPDTIDIIFRGGRYIIKQDKLSPTGSKQVWSYGASIYW